jgi:hypothetical protein
MKAGNQHSAAPYTLGRVRIRGRFSRPCTLGTLSMVDMLEASAGALLPRGHGFGPESRRNRQARRVLALVRFPGAERTSENLFRE